MKNFTPTPGQRFKLPSGNIVKAYGTITEGIVPCEYIGAPAPVGGVVFTAQFLRLPSVEWLQ